MRGYRLWLADKASWTEIEDMSLEEVDLHCLMLDVVADARERQRVADRMRGTFQ